MFMCVSSICAVRLALKVQRCGEYHRFARCFVRLRVCNLCCILKLKGNVVVNIAAFNVVLSAHANREILQRGAATRDTLNCYSL